MEKEITMGNMVDTLISWIDNMNGEDLLKTYNEATGSDLTYEQVEW